MNAFLPGLAGLLLLTALHQPIAASTASEARITLNQPVLDAPSFASPTAPAYETDLIFGLSNPNADSETEIFRSLSATEGYELIATVLWSDRNFLDSELKSNTTYYYKLRAIRDGDASAYSDILSLTSGHKLYAPGLTAYAFTATTVQLVLEDRSYNDTSYDIWREQAATATLISTITASDSGQIFTITDEGLRPETEYAYRVDVKAQGPGNVIYHNMVRVTTRTWRLPPPDINFFLPYGGSFCRNHIIMVLFSGDNESLVELYRSLYPDKGFEHITTTTDVGSQWHTDENLLPRRTYYYKARTVNGDGFSDFSSVVSTESGERFYNPIITATDMGDKTVRITLQDNSFFDDYYEIYGRDMETGAVHFKDMVFMPDSGGVYTITDDAVDFNKTYLYDINVFLRCAESPEESGVGSATVTVMAPGGPFVTNFVLVDPETDEDVQELHDDAEFESAPRYNIRVNASAKTQSVRFFLNGKRFGENEVPYALYGDRFGNYHRGRLKPGSYTLTATPWSRNNYKGEKGNTLTLHFTVRDSKNAKDNIVAGSITTTVVAIFPNPAINIASVEVSSTPQSHISITLIDSDGNKIRNTQEITNPEGYLKTDFDVAGLGKGIYLLYVKINNKTITKRLLIE